MSLKLSFLLTLLSFHFISCKRKFVCECVSGQAKSSVTYYENSREQANEVCGKIQVDAQSNQDPKIQCSIIN